MARRRKFTPAWTLTGGDGITVAVVDTGLDLDHPDLVDRLVPGWDVVDGDPSPDDDNGHGTHVAGIVAASANEIGTAGAAPLALIMPVRVLDDEGSGSDADIAQGTRWTTEHGADIINLSLGQVGLMGRLMKGGDINAAIREAAAQGVLVVAASGNEGQAGRQYRIGVDVLVVNATDASGALAEFSNVGDTRTIGAPGVDILSTAPLTPTTLWPSGTEGTATLSGTSMATPVVSGVLALMLAAGTPATDAVSQLIATASLGSGDPLLGAGIADAGAALHVTTPLQDGETNSPNPGGGTEPSIPAPSGGGTIALSMTAPRAATVSVAATVSCDTPGRTYTAKSGQSGDSVSIAFSITGAPYRGSGELVYAGSVTVRLGDETVVVPLAGTGTVASDLSGSLSIATEEVALTLEWSCG